MRETDLYYFTESWDRCFLKMLIEAPVPKIRLVVSLWNSGSNIFISYEQPVSLFLDTGDKHPKLIPWYFLLRSESPFHAALLVLSNFWMKAKSAINTIKNEEKEIISGLRFILKHFWDDHHFINKHHSWVFKRAMKRMARLEKLFWEAAQEMKLYELLAKRLDRSICRAKKNILAFMPQLEKEDTTGNHIIIEELQMV